MKIILDGSELALSSSTISEGRSAIYKEATNAAAKDGRVITQIFLDGEEIVDPAAFAKTDHGTEIKFVSQSVRELASESIEEGSHYLPKLIAGLGAVADKFEQKRDQEAHSLFSSAAEGINWIIGVFDRICGLMGLNATTFKTGDFNADQKEIESVLTDLNAALEKKEQLKLAFIIRERLIPTIERFKLYWEEAGRSIEGKIQ